MRCLSVCQPWAWALIHGPKRVENRTWKTSYRGPLLIHSGKSHKWDMPTLPDGTDVPTDLAYGVLVGVVDLVDCVPYIVSLGPFAIPGHWCWIVENPRPCEQVAWKGQLSLFEVPESAIQLALPPAVPLSSANGGSDTSSGIVPGQVALGHLYP